VLGRIGCHAAPDQVGEVEVGSQWDDEDGMELVFRLVLTDGPAAASERKLSPGRRQHDVEPHP
jgi:hypothetical protein